MTSSSAAALLVEEGLRMGSYPGIAFRDGPVGRRAVLANNPDVWEVIRAVRQARATEPAMTPDEVLTLVADSATSPLAAVRLAVSYYSAFPAEMDVMISGADAAEAAAAWERSRKRLEA